MNFEEKILGLRKKWGLSQEQLAEKLSVSRQAISKWESGTTYPDTEKLILLSKVFDVTIDSLVNDGFVFEANAVTSCAINQDERQTEKQEMLNVESNKSVSSKGLKYSVLSLVIIVTFILGVIMSNHLTFLPSVRQSAFTEWVSGR